MTHEDYHHAMNVTSGARCLHRQCSDDPCGGRIINIASMGPHAVRNNELLMTR